MAKAKMATDIPTSITMPESVETRLGTLRFTDGFPDDATVQKVLDTRFPARVEALLTTMPVASLNARPKSGVRSFGPDNRTVIHFRVADRFALAVSHRQHGEYLRVSVARPQERSHRRRKSPEHAGVRG